MSKQTQQGGAGLGLGRCLEHDILVCGTCLRQFSEIEPFILHKTHHVQGGNVYSCELCMRAFSSHTVLLYHYRTFHQLQVWDPRTWNSTAAHAEAPADPQTAPGPEIPGAEPAAPGTDVHFILTTESVKGRAFNYGRMALKCLHCAQKYYSKEELIGHMSAMHPGAECPPLPQVALQGEERVISVTDYEAYVKSLRRRSSSQKPGSGRTLERPQGKKFVCPVCKKSFTRRRILQLHTCTHQAGYGPFCGTQQTASPRRLHQCQQCSFQSAVSAVAWLHRQEHRQGTMTCKVCHCAYSDRSTLNKHMRVHDAQRPYGCSFPRCGWRFKSEVLLRAHLQAHVSPGQFECPSCGYAFRHKHHLQRHQARMHGAPSSRAKEPDSPPAAQLRGVLNTEQTQQPKDAADGAVFEALSYTGICSRETREQSPAPSQESREQAAGLQHERFSCSVGLRGRDVRH